MIARWLWDWKWTMGLLNQGNQSCDSHGGSNHNVYMFKAYLSWLYKLYMMISGYIMLIYVNIIYRPNYLPAVYYINLYHINTVYVNVLYIISIIPIISMYLPMIYIYKMYCKCISYISSRVAPNSNCWWISHPAQDGRITMLEEDGILRPEKSTAVPWQPWWSLWSGKSGGKTLW